MISARVCASDLAMLQLLRFSDLGLRDFGLHSTEFRLHYFAFLGNGEFYSERGINTNYFVWRKEMVYVEGYLYD